MSYLKNKMIEVLNRVDVLYMWLLRFFLTFIVLFLIISFINFINYEPIIVTDCSFLENGDFDSLSMDDLILIASDYEAAKQKFCIDQLIPNDYSNFWLTLFLLIFLFIGCLIRWLCNGKWLGR